MNVSMRRKIIFIVCVVIIIILLLLWISRTRTKRIGLRSDNTHPGCRKCFLACGKAGKGKDPTRYLFCCDICREFGYTDCDEHGCGNGSDGTGKTPNDPIGDFIVSILDPTKWANTSQICCDQLTKGQLLDMAGRDISVCRICDRPAPNTCTVTDEMYKGIVGSAPIKQNYVHFQSDTKDSIQSCQGLLTDGPVPNIRGRGNPNGPDGYVYNHSIGGGVVPGSRTDKYLDESTNIFYGFRPITEFIPSVMPDMIPNVYLYYRKTMDTLNKEVNISGNSSTLDAIFQATTAYGKSGWTLTLSALDKNPYSMVPNSGWAFPVKINTLADNSYFNTLVPLDPSEKPLPFIVDNIVKGQWAALDMVYI